MKFITNNTKLPSVLFALTATASMLGGTLLTTSQPVQAGVSVTFSLKNPGKSDVFYLSEANKRSAEHSLYRNNCALFSHGIKCAYGNARYRHYILKSVRHRHAYAFRGDGRVLQYYVERVGLDKALLELQRLDIDFRVSRRTSRY